MTLSSNTSVSTAFDAFAGDYDDNFTNSALGRLLRPRVWEKLAEHFRAGQHILELACGTGEDALWLAKQGLRVTATDGSPEMVRLAAAKAQAAGLADRLVTAQLSWQEITSGRSLAALAGSQFDGGLSNFGGLNTIDDWSALAAGLSHLIRPGGKLILVPMGPFCPWEIVWYLSHAQPKTAFRRFRPVASAKIGQTTIPIWYPSAKRLRRAFSTWFEHRRTESLGLWLPPSYLDHFVNKWPAIFARLNRFEHSIARLTAGWGDHYISIFERKS
jgi:ubiquinone/menaquinone biosynthesis C-methylase UbiE